MSNSVEKVVSGNPAANFTGSPQPFFSVIIPTYNRASFLPRTLQSVLAQTYPHFEILVVDDGSTDNTEAVMQEWIGEKVQYHKKANAERAAARNYGTKHSRGDYITFLDSDDLLYPNYLQNAVESLAHYQNPPFLHLGYEVTDKYLNAKVRINTLLSDDISMFVKGNPLSCMGVFLRRDVAQEFLFNEDRQLSGSEDWELWIRIAAHVGIKTDNRIGAALIDHDSRSVQHFSREKLVARKELVLKYAFADARVQEKFGRHKSQIEAYWDSYIALHLVLSRHYGKGMQFWLQSAIHYPKSILERRTLAIFKHVLTGPFRK